MPLRSLHCLYAAFVMLETIAIMEQFLLYILDKPYKTGELEFTILYLYPYLTCFYFPYHSLEIFWKPTCADIFPLNLIYIKWLLKSFYFVKCFCKRNDCNFSNNTSWKILKYFRDMSKLNSSFSTTNCGKKFLVS